MITIILALVAYTYYVVGDWWACMRVADWAMLCCLVEILLYFGGIIVFQNRIEGVKKTPKDVPTG